MLKNMATAALLTVAGPALAVWLVVHGTASRLGADETAPGKSASKEIDQQLLDDLSGGLLEGLAPPSSSPPKTDASKPGASKPGVSGSGADGKQEGPPAAGKSSSTAPPAGTSPQPAPAGPTGQPRQAADDQAADDQAADDQAGEDVGAENPLVRIGRQMKSVEQRIASRDTSQPTQAMQQRIVADLASLIEQLQQQCANSSSSSSSSRREGGQPEGQGSQAGNQAGQQAAAAPARDSSDRLEQARPEDLEGEQVQDVIKQVWGHLPPRVRDLMRSASIEEFLPKYERLIEAYYQRLAEEE